MALCLFSEPARAQGAATARPDACAKDPVCRDHADRAHERSRQGLRDDALKEVQEAFGLQPMPRLVFNIARVQQKLGPLDAAARSYELYLNLGAEGNLELAAKARSYLDEIYIAGGHHPHSGDPGRCCLDPGGWCRNSTLFVKYGREKRMQRLLVGPRAWLPVAAADFERLLLCVRCTYFSCARCSAYAVR